MQARNIFVILIPTILDFYIPNQEWTSIQLKLKVVVGVCNYFIFLANIF